MGDFSLLCFPSRNGLKTLQGPYFQSYRESCTGSLKKQYKLFKVPTLAHAFLTSELMSELQEVLILRLCASFKGS
jgi:hypothetical protein